MVEMATTTADELDAYDRVDPTDPTDGGKKIYELSVTDIAVGTTRYMCGTVDTSGSGYQVVDIIADHR